MRISIGFFDDIHVPQSLLQKPSSWSTEEKLWVWELYPDNPLYLDLENQARFRVVKVSYHHSNGPPQHSRPASADAVAMQITASIDESGLGLVDWWPDDMQTEENRNQG